MPYKDPEKRKANNKEWRRKNADKMRVYDREKARRPDVKAQRREYRKEWASRPDVKTRLAKLNKEWSRRNSAARVESVRRYQKKTGYKRSAILRRPEWILRRTRTKGAAGTFTRHQWLWRLEYYGYRCSYCDRELSEATAQIDHVIPISRGGSNWPSNLVPACALCNMRKGVKKWIPSRKASGQEPPRVKVSESG